MGKSELNVEAYLILNGWLQVADNHYIQGRFLWRNYGFQGANILLWLSCEQMMKLLIIQKNKKTGSDTSFLTSAILRV